MSIFSESNVNIFVHPDIVKYLSRFLDTPELFLSCSVSQLWNKVFSEKSIWEEVYVKEKIPLVGGEGRDRKKDLKDIYPMIISGKMTDQNLGKMIGEMPYIHSSFMDILDMPDPLDRNSTIRKNYQFVVVPHNIDRTTSQKNQAAEAKYDWMVAQYGPLDGEKVFSFQTLLLLGKHFMDGSENCGVFNSELVNEIYNDDKPLSDKISIYFIRKRVSSVTIGKKYEDVEKYFKGKGFEVVPGLVRAFAMYIAAMKSEDAYKQFAGVYAITPETFRVYAGGLFSGDWIDNCHLAIGLSGCGVEICREGKAKAKKLGAAAGISAEVEPTALLSYLKQTFSK